MGNGATRRKFLRRAGLIGGGAVAGGALAAGGETVLARAYPSRVHPSSAPATPADRRHHPEYGDVQITWHAATDQKLIALTFDDGPRPNWTPMVLDILDDTQVAATFFLIGQRVLEHADILRGRMNRHEAGNHTWAHRDLATLDYGQAREAIGRAHEAITTVTGQQPRYLRPPYGHLGGSTLLAAADFRYQVALWSLQMIESEFTDRPAGLVDYIVTSAHPGAIVLAHDTGAPDRLVALQGLPDMIEGLRAKGFRFVTVSQLLAQTQKP